MDALETQAHTAWEQFLDSDRARTHTSAYPALYSERSADWERLVASADPSISLGALLLWLQDTPSDKQSGAIDRVLASVNPRWADTARWLTAGI